MLGVFDLVEGAGDLVVFGHVLNDALKRLVGIENVGLVKGLEAVVVGTRVMENVL